MKTNRILKIMPALLIGLASIIGCSKENTQTAPTNPFKPLEGYASPNGIMVLNQGARPLENSTITYIAPDGTIKENIYLEANNTYFGNEAQDMYMYNGKIYIISNGLYSPGGVKADGVLVIADAQTMKLEKAYKMSDLRFKRPEGSLEPYEYLPLTTPLDNIAVLDESNIFITDPQGVFRFDSTTGEMNIVEGAYHFGNQGATIECIAIGRGILRVGDHLYCGGGGFWASTRLLEFSKGENKVTRVLPDLKGDFISGICRTGEREIMLATCGRKGEKKSYLHFIDLDSWTVTREKAIPEDISAEFFNTSGISLAGDYIYYSAGTTKIRRLSLKSWKAEDYIDTTLDAPLGIYLNCNVYADPTNNYLYVAVSDVYQEQESPTNNYLLVYDCNGDKPKLVRNIHNQTNYTIGVFPLNKFYKY